MRPVYWTKDRIQDAMRQWFELYGSLPAAADWDPYMAKGYGHHERVERFLSGQWPSRGTVASRYGSWKIACETCREEIR